jgi:nucleoside-diphosphate-sugar epimerase
MTRHLILGGCGFIGRHVALALHRRGDTVIISDIAPPPAGQAAVLPVDFRLVDPAAPDWESLIDDCDVIHHYAWTTVPSSANADPLGDFDANLRNTVRLLEALKKSPGKRLVFSSSGGTIYGRLNQIPVPETHPFALMVYRRLQPNSILAITISLERLTAALPGSPIHLERGKTHKNSKVRLVLSFSKRSLVSR